jgi:hypothetical protein
VTSRFRKVSWRLVAEVPGALVEELLLALLVAAGLAAFALCPSNGEVIAGSIP